MGNDVTDVYLVTGFLGSGKTTLLNRLLRQIPPDRSVFVLENEFGEPGIECRLLQGQEGRFEEISHSSSFCLCAKTEFVKFLKRISEDIQPDVVLVESTGVMDITGFEKNLDLPLYRRPFRLRETICVLDAQHFSKACDAFSCVQKQIASSNRFILNKLDTGDPNTRSRIRETIHTYHTDPPIHECTYCNVDLSPLFSETPAQGRLPASGERSHLEGDELERYVTEFLMGESAKAGPPDLLMAITIQWEGEGKERLEQLIPQFPEGIVRAKGLVVQGTALSVFSYVYGEWTLTDAGEAAEGFQNRVVLLGDPQSIMPIHGWGELYGLTVVA